MTATNTPAVETNTATTATSTLEQERALILQFLELIAKAKTCLVFQFQSRQGELSACKREHPPIKISNPKVYMGGTAWVGLEIAGERIRTETIKCRDRFVTWVKEVMELLTRQVEQAGTLFGSVFVPVEVCFVPVMYVA